MADLTQRLTSLEELYNNIRINISTTTIKEPPEKRRENHCLLVGKKMAKTGRKMAIMAGRWGWLLLDADPVISSLDTLPISH